MYILQVNLGQVRLYTAILTAEKSDKIDSVLVLTKKAAIGGWEKFIDGNELLKHKYKVTNYEQAHKLNPSHYDLVIIDESHNLGNIGKPSPKNKDH
jgi:superfamily II DNA or RNA helicase